MENRPDHRVLCTHCGELFASSGALKNHLDKQKGSIAPPPNPGPPLLKYQSLDIYIYVHKDPDLKSTTCSFLVKVIHFIIFTLIAGVQHYCPECNAGPFFTKKGMTRHLEVFIDIYQKYRTCILCKSNFHLFSAACG